MALLFLLLTCWFISFHPTTLDLIVFSSISCKWRILFLKCLFFVHLEPSIESISSTISYVCSLTSWNCVSMSIHSHLLQFMSIWHQFPCTPLPFVVSSISYSLFYPIVHCDGFWVMFIWGSHWSQIINKFSIWITGTLCSPFLSQICVEMPKISWISATLCFFFPSSGRLYATEMSFSFLAWTMATSSQSCLIGKLLLLNCSSNFFFIAFIGCLLLSWLVCHFMKHYS